MQVHVRCITSNDRFGEPRKPRKWEYVIFTGSRCSGLKSCRKYTTQTAANGAGRRMVKKLGGSD